MIMLPIHVTTAFVLFAATVAAARVVEVRDDASLAAALADARAGDEIRLAPGIYQGGIHVTLAGEKDRPIIVASDDPKNRAIIQGRSGLHVAGAKNIVLKDLIVKGSTGNGINIDDAGKMDHSAVGIRVENCDVMDTGPKGNLDGIKLSGLKDFEIVGCRVEGWGGSAVDMVGCLDGVIRDSQFIGKDGFDQSSGIQMKGGTRNLTVKQNRFTNAGARALNVGGSTGLPFFRPLDAGYEAKDIVVEHNILRGSETPVAFVGVDGAIFRQNTIIKPDKWVMRILQESRDERFVKCRNVAFTGNLIVYSQTQVRTFANIGDDTRPETFTFSKNWWFCADGKTVKPALPVAETDSIYGQDPKLSTDDFPTPTNPAAKSYGASPSNIIKKRETSE